VKKYVISPPLDFTSEELHKVVQRLGVAVIGFHIRGGSTFLQGLLDQYKEIATATTMTGVYDFYDHQEGPISPETYVEYTEKNFPCLIDDSVDNLETKESYFSGVYNVFFALCTMYGKCERKEYFLLLHIAFSLVSGKRLQDLTCVLFHLHSPTSMILRVGAEKVVSSEDQFERLFRDFPKAKLMTTLRRPACGIESFMAAGDGSTSEFANNLMLIMRTVARLREVWTPERPIFLFDLPSVHRSYDAVMGRLCSFLGIPYDPTLRSSTFYGEKADVGYSAKQKIANQPIPNFVDWKGGILSSSQVSAIRFFCHEIYAKFFPEDRENANLQRADILRAVAWCVRALCSMRSMDDAYNLKEIFKYYVDLRELPFLDISCAVSGKE
jgi:hypothetical protein